jgi:hypothetical protein
MTNESRKPRPNPYELLPAVPSMPRNAGAAGDAASTKGAMQIPNDARLASHVGAAPPRDHGPLARAMLVATAETGGGQS